MNRGFETHWHQVQCLLSTLLPSPTYCWQSGYIFQGCLWSPVWQSTSYSARPGAPVIGELVYVPCTDCKQYLADHNT